ncbi:MULTISPECIES: LysR family transcriptional regulator [unclassified Ensifer]|uniref:LysR family transcriptional regulator n=1 Tax=unclassified Ensifer TaxID=2633371 RepID=UPI0008139ACE|nr:MULTISPECIES: LysR family transcriptional regulator [unclassified Ensifer]OCP07146.1 LysR family transcriptional regulator [Ensifer sp. LC11]OCP07729.1 LysR family transcriptional regulator [Ensifer sp. LC13]OCP12109.1 LysR family transcriptional regulator [Ensifer sp. LC14]OCP31820.1 LysR family transcriptional regulator [Ensifer sp. LC499]
MDNRAGEMEVFVAVSETRSFSAAARRLKLSPSAVSKLVTRIEDRLGTRLVVRSTRTLQLTPEGEVYLQRAQRILAEIVETEQLVAAGGRTVPRGLLRVNAAVGFGERYIMPLAPEFLARYPEVRLDLTLTDSMIDVVGERADVAIRTGPLRDSSLKARKLMESRPVVIASPAYLEKHGVPQTPDDLDGHNCIRFNFRRSVDEWAFRMPDQSSELRSVFGNMQVSSGSIVRQLCLAGVGIGRIGRFHVEPDFDAGTLVPLLEDYRSGEIETVYAVYAGHEHLAARIRAFIDFLAERM